MVGSRGFLSLYWSSSHSRAERFPSLYSHAFSGTPASVVRSSQGYRPPLLVGPQDGPLRVNVLSVVALQRIRLGGLEPDVQVQQLLAHLAPVVEVPVQGQAGKLPQQVHGVLLTVHRIVEHGVGVGENLLGGDAVLSGQGLEVIAPLLPVVPVDPVDAPPSDVAHPLPVPGVSVDSLISWILFHLAVDMLLAFAQEFWELLFSPRSKLLLLTWRRT